MTDKCNQEQEAARNKNLEAQKSSEAPVEEAKVSQACAHKEVEHLDNQPSETKASEKTDVGAGEKK